MPSTIEERFWSKVNKTETCWLWTAYLHPLGYGRFYFNATGMMAHRYAYELLIGSIPAGLELDHLCRHPSCVRPSHLEPVTHRVNVLRGEGLAAKNARVTHCSKGHPFDSKNTYLYGTQRYCRTCNNNRYKKSMGGAA